MFRRVSIRITLLGGDLTAIALALFIATWVRPQLAYGEPLTPASVSLGWQIYAMAVVIWGLGFIFMDVYSLQKNLRITDELLRLILAHAAMALAFAGILYFSFREISRLQIFYFVFIGLALLVVYRSLFRLLLRLFGDKRYGTRRVLVVGAGTVGQEVGQIVVENRWTGLRLVGFVDDNPQANTGPYPHLGSLEQTIEVAQEYNINEVIFALPRAAHLKLANQVSRLQNHKINVRVVPDFFDLVFLRSVVEDIGGMPLITLREPALDPLQRLIKRMFDLGISTLGLILISPLMGLFALIIKLDSPGPVLFKQQRIGENGRLFTMYKFRSMVADAEARQEEVIQTTAAGQIIHKTTDDPRVTRFGHFLRRTSLDELPQLFNIFTGDMSLVGPRPELPWLVDRYEPWQRKRFEVPQGLTGWWQVNGRSDKPMHLHTDEDLYYIKHYSIWLDLRILWRTIKAVIDRRGAY